MLTDRPDKNKVPTFSMSGLSFYLHKVIEIYEKHQMLKLAFNKYNERRIAVKLFNNPEPLLGVLKYCYDGLFIAVEVEDEKDPVFFNINMIEYFIIEDMWKEQDKKQN